MNSLCPHIRVTTFLTYRKSQFHVINWKHLETGQIDLIRNVAVLRNVKKKSFLSSGVFILFPLFSLLHIADNCLGITSQLNLANFQCMGYWVKAKYNYASLYLGKILVSGFPKLCTAVLSLGFAVRSIQLMFTILQQEMTDQSVQKSHSGFHIWLFL